MIRSWLKRLARPLYRAIHRPAFRTYRFARRRIFLAYWHIRSAPRNLVWTAMKIRWRAIRVWNSSIDSSPLYGRVTGWRFGVDSSGRRLVRMGIFQLVPFSHAVREAKSQIVLAQGSSVTYRAPIVHGHPAPSWPKVWTDTTTKVAPLIVAQWGPCSALGRSDSLFVQDKAVVSDYWNRETEFTRDEVTSLIRQSASNQMVARSIAAIEKMQMDKGILILGGPTVNWAHWLTEYLPRLALIDTVEEYFDWPLIVDGALPNNMVESLRLIGTRSRCIQFLDEGQVMRLQCAVTVSSPGYTAYEYRYNKETELPINSRDRTVFSPFALKLMREKAWKNVGAQPEKRRSIYITRPRGSARPFVGSEKIESYFSDLGFELVDTSTMSVSDQIKLFSSARCIVGQSGAGMTNLVFAPAGCLIFVFAANSPHSIFHYFANMGATLDQVVHYFYGESIYVPGAHPGHAGFSVDFEEVKRAWEAIQEEVDGQCAT
jgi:capsular polysaccharide biosynthesis protein